jgi:hypothetical protein
MASATTGWSFIAFKSAIPDNRDDHLTYLSIAPEKGHLLELLSYTQDGRVEMAWKMVC